MTIRVLLFAAARQAAGRGADEFDTRELDPAGECDLDAILELAVARYGPEFAAVLARARVWVNGDEPARGRATALADGDEVAVLPPVSGGAVPR